MGEREISERARVLLGFPPPCGGRVRERGISPKVARERI
jgi:hypothetical protein